jgi:hypothetical protein
VQPVQELLQKWDERGRFHPRIEITGDGLTLGAGTVLAKMVRDKRSKLRVTLDDEPRVIAACHSL